MNPGSGPLRAVAAGPGAAGAGGTAGGVLPPAAPTTDECGGCEAESGVVTEEAPDGTRAGGRTGGIEQYACGRAVPASVGNGNYAAFCASAVASGVANDWAAIGRRIQNAEPS